jgi:hypothetical protein
MMFSKAISSILLILTLFISGCIDIEISDLGLIDSISVNQDGSPRGMALSMDENIYVTDFKGNQFLKIAENNIEGSSVSWPAEGILFTSKLNNLWSVKIYSPKFENTDVLLQEFNAIRLPVLKLGNLSYMVLPEEEKLLGSINIYNLDSSRVTILFDSAYYDYEWLAGGKDIAAITVSNTIEGGFSGSVVIKNVDTLTEKVVFTGDFVECKDFLDTRKDGTIIFGSLGEIYLYNIGTEELSKWHGPTGYDFRLPPSVSSSLKGYILAKVSGIEEDWTGQLYLINLKDEFIPIPGWPIWIEEPLLVYVDLDCGDLYSINLDTQESENITKKYEEYGPKKN